MYSIENHNTELFIYSQFTECIRKWFTHIKAKTEFLWAGLRTYASESVAWTAGDSTRQMGKQVGGSDPSCGTLCERDTQRHRGAGRVGRDMAVSGLGNKVKKEG